MKSQECGNHRWQASKDSVFGLKNIHAILVCRACATKETKYLGVRPLTDFDLKVSKNGSHTYFLNSTVSI